MRTATNGIGYPRTVRLAGKGLLAGMLVLMPVATLLPGTSPPSDMAATLHFWAMAWTAFVACVAFQETRSRLFAVLFVFALSAGLEFLQYLLPYRHGCWEDVWINGAGCLAGVGFFVALGWFWNLASNVES